MVFARPSVLTPVLTPVFALYHQSFCTSASTADTDTTGGTTYPLPAEVSAIALMVPYVAAAWTTIVLTVAVGYVAKVLAAMAVTMGVWTVNEVSFRTESTTTSSDVEGNRTCVPGVSD